MPEGLPLAPKCSSGYGTEVLIAKITLASTTAQHHLNLVAFEAAEEPQPEGLASAVPDVFATAVGERALCAACGDVAPLSKLLEPVTTAAAMAVTLQAAVC